MDSLQALAHERRSGITTIRGRRFRITEPRPMVASVLLTHLERLLGPWLRRVLGGYVVRYAEPVCPRCGSDAGAEQINGQRWLCQADHEGKPCGMIWPREAMVGPDGQPVRITLGYAMADPGLRQVLAYHVEQAMEAMDADEAHALGLRMVLAGTEWDASGTGAWVAATDERTLEMALAQAKIGGIGIHRLAKAHLEVWALPSLVDDWTDTSPASSASVTPGGSETREPEPPEHAPAGRVPPRTQKRKG